MINKFDIHDQNKLDKIEYNYASLNITSLLKKPIKIKSVFDICDIHRIIFGDIYEWAGQFKKILHDAINNKEINNSKYKKLKEYDLDKYEYSYHKYKD